MRRRDEAAGGRRGKAAAAPQSAGQEHLNEGQRLQQQAERNKDNGARCGIFASAAERFRAALQHALSADDRADAAFGLGECLQRWAEAHVSAARAAPLSAGLLAAEASAGAASATLCQQSLEAYALVRGDDGAPREDALVNSGNVLSAWAELVADAAPAEAAALLARACEAYEAASAAAPAEEAADVELLRSWADALVRRAELAAGAGDGASADACYGRALGAYAAACGGADSTKGDDVAGLLYNWGCGLQSLAKHRPGPGGSAQHLELAAAKLRTAAEFGAGDADPLNALGDVLQDAAEAAASAGRGGEAAELLQRALDDGFLRALRLSRGNADAQVGVAETRLAQARAAAAAGDASSAAAAAAGAADAYAAALAQPAALGTVSERLDVQYNFACAAAQCGRFEEANRALSEVLACGGTTLADAEADQDLAPLRAATMRQ